jgi:hypothetical protein
MHTTAGAGTTKRRVQAKTLLHDTPAYTALRKESSRKEFTPEQAARVRRTGGYAQRWIFRRVRCRHSSARRLDGAVNVFRSQHGLCTRRCRWLKLCCVTKRSTST